jgi:hypothetical protein
VDPDGDDEQRRRVPEANYAAAIYGSILVAAMVASLSEAHADAGTLAVAVLASMVVFWMAHVWSDAVAARLRHPGPFSWPALRAAGRSQWPMLQAAALPVAVLVLAWAGAWSVTTAETLALAVSVVQLAAWGLFVGFHTFSSWPLAILSACVDGALGLTIVALKVLVQH